MFFLPYKCNSKHESLLSPNQYQQNKHTLISSSSSHNSLSLSTPIMGSLGTFEPPTLPSRISTVVPATPRGEQNGGYDLSYMDILLKLHYIRPVYFFGPESVQGLSISDLKTPMFPLLDTYSHVSGRIRRSESGRPFIKCNDAGVRIAESHCEMTMNEWFNEMGYSIDGLVHDHVLGPDLGFSPLVFVKFTWFKCGGLSVGLSWAHVLGDAFSAFSFITKWSQILAGHVPPKSLLMPNITQPEFQPQNPVSENPVSAKRARIIGEYWLATDDSDVATHSFHVTSKQLHNLVNQNTNNNNKSTSSFEMITALIWKTIADIKGEFGPRVVTICTHINGSNRGENEVPSNNGLVLSKFEANFVEESEISELARMIAEKKMAENQVMEEMVEQDEGKEDYIVYGANLTFVDLEEANFYSGMKLNGQKPIMANCSFRGVGDQGVVLVLPAPPPEEEENNEDDNYGNGRIVTVSLPQKELDQLKDKLGRKWSIV